MADEQKPARRSLAEWLDSPEWVALREDEDRETADFDAYVASDDNVSAKITCPAMPEQFEGTIDGRRFYFRERHGVWRIEVDDEVVAHGSYDDLQFFGHSHVGHMKFVVRTVRDVLRQQACSHSSAGRFCPDCGVRIGPQ